MDTESLLLLVLSVMVMRERIVFPGVFWTSCFFCDYAVVCRCIKYASTAEILCDIF